MKKLSIAFLMLFLLSASMWAESFFPRMKHIVPEGTTLPRPYGIGYVHHYQNQRFGLAETTLGDTDLPSAALDRVGIHNIAHIESARFDVWVLPFLNLYTILAYGHGSAEVAIETPNRQDDIQGGYTWTSKGFGFGMIPTFGYGKFFVATNLNYSFVWRTGSELSTAWIFNPRLGYSFPAFRMWIGAMYQNIDDYQAGTLGESLSYAVNLSRGEPWNIVFGFHLPFWDDKMEFVLETGYGERVQVTTTVGYRFGGQE